MAEEKILTREEAKLVCYALTRQFIETVTTKPMNPTTKSAMEAFVEAAIDPCINSVKTFKG